MTPDATTGDRERLSEGMAGLREAAERDYGTLAPADREPGPEDCEVFGELPQELTPERRAELIDRIENLKPWLQGPFWLGGDLVIEGRWRADRRWEELGRDVADDLTGLHVLDIGSNAGFDAFMFKKRGADRVVGCEPLESVEQARFLESIYKTGVEFEQIGWEELNADALGQFDVVHCQGVLYREKHPLAMLERIRTMLKPGGTLFFGSMVLADPELAEYARFIPAGYYGDDTWWWVPGRLCLRWMLETAGFHCSYEFGMSDGPPGEFPVCDGYVRCQDP